MNTPTDRVSRLDPLLTAGLAGRHGPADTAERVETSTLLAVTRPVAPTAWLGATTPGTLSSVIGD